MSLAEFYQATPRETANILQGRFKAKEMETQVSWEQVRWQTWHLLNIQIEKNKRLKLEDLARFPWEKPKEKKQLTTQQLKQFLN
jgi:hypothetical protein